MALWVNSSDQELRSNASETDVQVLIRSVYKQVLGNAHLSESDRLETAESYFRDGRYSVKEFVRAVGQSDLYRRKFFESSSQYRFIELNFKHFLGRAPRDQAEISEHVQRYNSEGYDAEISSYIDSDEYDNAFGDNMVPAPRVTTNQGLSNSVFNNSLALMRGDAASDASGAASLITAMASNKAARIAQPSKPLGAPVGAVATGGSSYGAPAAASYNTAINTTTPSYAGPARPLVPVKAGTGAIPAYGPSAAQRFQDSLNKSADAANAQTGFTAASDLQGVARFNKRVPVELFPGRSNEEAETVIQAVYKQVLGNAYVMESERLVVPESQLKRGEISVREFVRQVAKSELYRSRFFDACPRYRYIELAFRHLLGRTPLDLEEMRGHSTTLDNEGFGADIDSFVDSAEYQDTFGEDTVPYLRGYETETCQSMVQFTHFFEMVRGDSTSSLKGSIAGKAPVLNSKVINTQPVPVKSGSGAGAIFSEPALGSRQRQGVGASSDGKVYRVEVTAYRSNVVNRVSKFRRSNKVYLVPFNKLSETYQRIHREGGVIASISPVS